MEKAGEKLTAKLTMPESQSELQYQSRLASITFKAKCCLFCMGLISHMGTVLVQAASADLASHFDKPEVISVFAGCLVAFSILVKFANARYLLHIRHIYRLIAAVTVIVASQLSIFLSMEVLVLPLCLFSTMLFGIGKSLNETVIYGFMKGLPPQSFVGLSSGQGLAGLTGSIYYYMMKRTGFKLQTSFLCLVPLQGVYLLLFLALIKIKVVYDELYQIRRSRKATEEEESLINKTLTCDTFNTILGKAWKYCLIMWLLYFSTYSTFSYLMKRASGHIVSSEVPNCTFEMLQIFMQAGNFIGSSSLQYYKAASIGPLAVVQASIMALFFAFATMIKAGFPVLAFFVFAGGINMGMTYVNTYFQLLNDKMVFKSEKEVALNLMIICKESGVVTNSISGYLFNTLLFPPAIKPQVGDFLLNGVLSSWVD